jgi:hypothetical protein
LLWGHVVILDYVFFVPNGNQSGESSPRPSNFSMSQ